MKKTANSRCRNNTAKRLLSFAMALAMLLTLFPAITLTADAAAGDTLYLVPSSTWKTDNARFAAYFYVGDSYTWTDVTDSDGDGYYECTIPSGGYTSVIFCRMNPSSTTNSWDNKWNQTSELTIPTDGKNCMTLTEGWWDTDSGSWSTYTPTVVETTAPTGTTEPSESGNDDAVIIHFLNNLNWQAVCAYVWAENGDNDAAIGDWAWPGEVLTKDSDGYYTLELEYAPSNGAGLGMIFHNNNGTQTVDLTISNATLTASGATEVWVQPTTISDSKYNCNVATSLSDLVISPEVSGTSVTFRYKGTASKVQVAGDMTDGATEGSWGTTSMTKGSDGVWSCTMTLDPGVYQYKFIVDGSWINDPSNPVTVGKDSNNVVVVSDPDAVDTNEVTVKLHYYRSDANYTDWNVWVWSLAMDAGQYDFTAEGEEMVTSFTVNGRKNKSVSFIVRKGEWASQEYGERQIDLTCVASGTVHCYVTSGQQAISVIYGEDVVFDNKILTTSLDYDSNAITVTTALPVSDPASAFSIAGATIKSVSADGCTYTLTPSATLSLDTLYQNVITFLGYEYGVNYSTTAYASDKFAEEFAYYGGDLGATWSASSTTFKVWAPTATAVSVKLYATGSDSESGAKVLGTYAMTLGSNGVWSYTKSGNQNGVYYTYLVTVDGKTVEACDPYAVTTGVNGDRAMVLDLDSTDPEGWDEDTNPNPSTNYTDAIIYELHVRDFSIDDSSGIKDEYQGKFMAFTQTGTTVDADENGTGDGEIPSGIDYLESMGFTHLHLLPVFDYNTVDETTCEDFNWGYSPENFNVPEGSFATDPYDGAVRVSEMKQMVKSLHDAGISVIMDVVYNHVYDAGSFCYNKIVPNYFSRQNADGSYSNGSGCGNDTASEREMVRDYIVSSIMYWKEEYHIDGFRFDLVGLLDAETINAIVDTVHAKYPDVIFYGEGWPMGTAVEGGTDNTPMATQGNSAKTPNFAYFSDNMRNLLGGNNGNSLGYVSGLTGQEETVANNFMARPGWTSNPYQIIQYASCHDNYTLVDKLMVSTGRTTVDSSIVKMNNLAAAVYMTSQGVAFIHAGEEFLREKLEEDGGRCENSYNAPDSVNHIEWSNLAGDIYNTGMTYLDNVEYYKGLIEFRKNHAALRLTNSTDITNNVTYTWITNEVVMFTINGGINGEVADKIVVIFNATSSAKTVSLPTGTWSVCIDSENAGVEELYTASGSVSVAGISAMVLVQGDLAMACEHDYTSVVTAPTCTAGGYTTYTCSKCGDTYTDNETAATGHGYTSSVTTAATCGAAGVRTYTCSGCGDTYTESIAATGNHSYVSGTCSVCGAADPDYVEPSTSTVALAGDFNSWDATAYMTASGTNTVTTTLELSAGTYGFKIVEDGTWMGNGGTIVDTTTATSSVGWEMSASDSSNCTLSASGGTYVFTYYTDTNMLVITYTPGETGGDTGGETGSADDYYLFGYIDGVSYGEGDDYATLGEYKFVNGSLTTTFVADSYVGVKTGDNSSWYMTDGWLGSVTTATLYDSSVYDLGTTADKLMVPGGVEVTFTLTVNADNTVTLSYEADTLFIEDTSGIQDGVTLHCWNWSFANIEANMATIAEQGYTAIQTSPIQLMKEATTNKPSGTNWWVFYQPVDFVINTDTGNALGTKTELISMIETAHEYGIKVIVDVVANHLGNQTGNDLSTAIPSYLRDNTSYWHDITQNISSDDYNNGNRAGITQKCMSGVPDLNTGNDDVQGYVLDYLKECIDAGVDGFRFDAAKHIETPEDDASFASDFWPTVIGGAEEYAETTRGIDLYVYGEVLDAPGGTLPISAYTEYMAVTDNSWGNTLRGNVAAGTAALSEGYNKAVDAAQLVLWAESHDTYANEDQNSDEISEANINKTWALVAGRADAMGLYFARPESLTTTLLGEADVTGWANAEVKAVNMFHNYFAGQDETLDNEGGIVYIERGTSGVILVNVAGNATSVSVTANAMADGTYTDQITGNTFTVANGTISGSIGSTGIAVVYNVPEEDAELFDIPLAAMTMGNSLAINFAFPQSAADDWTGSYVEIVKTYADGRADAVVTVSYDSWSSMTLNSVGYYYVTFNGIAAKEMSDEIYVTVYNADGEAISNTKTDSVRAQSMRIIDNVSAKEKTMVVDMLNYGAAAQEYFGYNTSDLANSLLTDTQASYASEPGTYTDIRATSDENGDYYYASNVNLESSIQLMLAFKNVDSSMYAVVSYTDHYGKAKSVTIDGSDFVVNGSFYVVMVDTLVVADGRQAVTCTVYNADGSEVVTITDSLESYTARKNGASVLFIKMMQYSDSAYTYFHN